ncbi:MAG: 3-hydroxyacyl-CoA dehydrogenase NAD-binding domain-containing protein [Pseudomonadota bacterium]
MSEPTASVTTERVGAIGLIAINNPPVNAASHAVREGLMNAIHTLEAEQTIDAIAIYGIGQTFVAGADIREFGKPPNPPLLTAVCRTIEECQTTVVAVLHGTTLGGGFEIALACHARAALPGTLVGFPEVTLGIIPGAGGTQRAPRLAGITPALDLITTGKRIDASEAKELNLVDEILGGEPRAVALQAAGDAVTGVLPVRRTRDLVVTPQPDALRDVKAALEKKQPHLFAPQKAVDAVAASLLPIDEGLSRERDVFDECLKSPQRAGLIHAFFAERAVSKIPEANAVPRPVNHIGVLGGGTMGTGIATASLLAGIKTTLVEQDEDALQKAKDTVASNLDGAVKRGKLAAQKRAKLLSEAFEGALGLEHFESADLIIEAVFEDMALKKKIFADLDEIAKDGAVLATNTSYLDVNEIAASTRRPGDVLGLHFFSPAHVMRLLEVVVGKNTAPDVVKTGFETAKALRKVAVRAGVCDGFIGNRILAHYRKAADYMVLDGARPDEVDAAVEAFGFAMGPFAVSDLAGLDIGYRDRQRRAPTRPAAERVSPVADQLVEAGSLGRKTASGYYLYGDTPRTPNPEVADIIDKARMDAGITPRAFSAEEITTRFMTAMISEAARVVGEDVALRPIDVDAVFLFGYGFPRFRGGPLHYADTLGAGQIVETISRLSVEDEYFWQVPPLLERLAREDKSFADLNAA